jgi:hypothetical protein
MMATTILGSQIRLLAMTEDAKGRPRSSAKTASRHCRGNDRLSRISLQSRSLNTRDRAGLIIV